MPSLDQIQKPEIRELRIEFVENDPDPLLMDVDMSLMTVGWHRGFKQFEDNDVGGVADHFFAPVKKWNLTGRDKKVLPLNAEGLDQLSLETFWDLVSKMGEAASPKEETSTPS